MVAQLLLAAENDLPAGQRLSGLTAVEANDPSLPGAPRDENRETYENFDFFPQNFSNLIRGVPRHPGSILEACGGPHACPDVPAAAIPMPN